MLKYLIILSLSFFLNFSVKSIEPPKAKPELHYASHPVPTNPVYLDSKYYETLIKEGPGVPAKNSKEQAEDEKILLEYQKNRTDKECQAAKEEVKVTLLGLFAKPHGPLDETKLTGLEPLFKQIRNDADFQIFNLKKHYGRPRPYVYLSSIHPCIDLEKSMAYPSGHATLGKLFALVLSDLFPDQKEAIRAQGDATGTHRVLGGVHHPSDIAAGRLIAEKIYKELKKSKKFQTDFEKAKTELNSAH